MKQYPSHEPNQKYAGGDCDLPAGYAAVDSVKDCDQWEYVKNAVHKPEGKAPKNAWL